MKLARFFSVGVLNTLFSYAVYCTLIYIEVYYILSSIISFSLGVLVSYVLNTRLTFSRRMDSKSLLKFSTIMCLSLLISIGMLFILKTMLNINVLIAQVLVVCIRFPIVYIVIKKNVYI